MPTVDPSLKKEFDFYLQQPEMWKSEHRGKFAVVFHQAIQGVYVAYEDALVAALKQFGEAPFLVHEVGEEDRLNVTTQSMLGAV